MFHKGLNFRPHGDGCAVDVHEHESDNSQVIRTVIFSQDSLLQMLEAMLPPIADVPICASSGSGADGDEGEGGDEGGETGGTGKDEGKQTGTAKVSVE